MNQGAIQGTQLAFSKKYAKDSKGMESSSESGGSSRLYGSREGSKKL